MERREIEVTVRLLGVGDRPYRYTMKHPKKRPAPQLENPSPAEADRRSGRRELTETELQRIAGGLAFPFIQT